MKIFPAIILAAALLMTGCGGEEQQEMSLTIRPV